MAGRITVKKSPPFAKLVRPAEESITWNVVKVAVPAASPPVSTVPFPACPTANRPACLRAARCAAGLQIFGQPERPAVWRLSSMQDVCGYHREEAIWLIGELERLTAWADPLPQESGCWFPLIPDPSPTREQGEQPFGTIPIKRPQLRPLFIRRTDVRRRPAAMPGDSTHWPCWSGGACHHLTEAW